MANKPSLPSSEDDWDDYRDTVTNLYMVQNQKCQTVIDVMRKRYNFEASEKQYKTHFRKWGLAKNFKRHEAHQIANGALPDSSRIRYADPDELKRRAARSLKRSQAREKAAKDAAPESRSNQQSTPTALSESKDLVVAPKKSVMPTLTPLLITPSIQSVELLLIKLRLYTHEAVVHGHWTSSNSPGNHVVGRKALRALSCDLTAGTKYFEEGKAPKAYRMWSRALEKAGSKQDLFDTWYYETPIALLFELGRLVHNGHADIAAQLVQMITLRAGIFLPDKDPRRSLFMAFESLETSQLRDAYERAAHSLREGLESRIEKHNPLLYQIRLHRALDLVWFDPKTDLTKWVPPVEQIDRALGSDNGLSIYFLMLEAYRLVAANSYEQAEDVCQEVSKRIHAIKHIPGRIDMLKIGMAYRRLGRQYYEQERYDDARRTLNQALMYIDQSKTSVLVEIYQNQEKLAALANDQADVELWRMKLQQMEATFVEPGPEEIISPATAGSYDENLMSDTWVATDERFPPGQNSFSQMMWPMNQATNIGGFVPMTMPMTYQTRPTMFFENENQGLRFTNDPESLYEPTFQIQPDSAALNGNMYPTMSYLSPNLAMSSVNPSPVMTSRVIPGSVLGSQDDYGTSPQPWIQ